MLAMPPSNLLQQYQCMLLLDRLLTAVYLLLLADVVSVLAGGSYVRCFNVVSGSLLWELSVASAELSHRASLQFIGTGECHNFWHHVDTLQHQQPCLLQQSSLVNTVLLNPLLKFYLFIQIVCKRCCHQESCRQTASILSCTLMSFSCHLRSNDDMMHWWRSDGKTDF